MKTTDIYENIKSRQIINKIDAVINGVSIDSRNINKNDLYIGIKGENFDGSLFFKDALKKGAKVAIINDVKIDDDLLAYLEKEDKCVIIVEDTIKTLKELAEYKRSLFPKPVVAITGSAGKTTTKDMIYSVLNTSYKVHKTIGNQNNHIGLPLTILKMEEEKDILVVEMGMNHLKEISYLTNIAKPNIAVITNIGTAHIGNLGSQENILKAKLEILEGLSNDGTLIINIDNDYLYNWYKKQNLDIKIKTFSINRKSDYQAYDIKETENACIFKCLDQEYMVPIGGEHFIYNALAAIAVGKEFNVTYPNIENGIKTFELSQNRMHLIEDNGFTIIDDCYNSNFDSLSYSIKYLGSLGGRKIACLGSMLELGEFSHDLHAKVGDLIVKEKIDYLVTVGKDAELINKRTQELGFDDNHLKHFESNKEASDYINKIKQKDDKILVKASQALNFKEIVENIK